MAQTHANCTLHSLKGVLLRNLTFPRDPLTCARSANANTQKPSHKGDKLRRHSIRNALPSYENASSDVELIEENAHKLLDLFFSLHVLDGPQKATLIYVSEAVYSSTNPSFGQISLPGVGGRKSPNIRLTVWTKRPFSSERGWQALLQLDLSLLKLVYIGPSIADKEDYFGNNSAVFNFNGRFFTIADALKVPIATVGDLSIRTTSNDPLLHATPSYSFETVRMLSSLKKSIRELRVSKNTLLKQISGLVHVLDRVDASNADKYRAEVTALDRHIIKQKSLNDTIHAEILSRKVQINRIRQLMDERFPSVQERYTNQIDMVEAQIEPISETLTQAVYPAIIQSLQALTIPMREFIPIESAGNGVFCIAGLEFPSSMKEVLETCYYNEKTLRVRYLATEMEEPFADAGEHTANVDQINACLSHVVQLANHLAEITGVALKHRMVHNGSHSYIVDSISSRAPFQPHIKVPEDANAPKVYPLYYDGRLTEKLAQEYGSGLLGRRVNLKNAPFEQALNLLRRNLNLLINGVSDAYDQFYQQERAKTQASSNIPAKQLENPLWSLEYVVLFVTALAKGSQ